MAKLSHNTGPEKEPKGGLEAAKTPELSTLLQSLATLRSAIHDNRPLSSEDVTDIQKQAGLVRVHIGSESESLVNLKKNPNSEIWGEILEGNTNRMEELTELPAFVVQQAPESVTEWELVKLGNLETETALAFSRRAKARVTIQPPTTMSRETADALLKNPKLCVRSDIEHTEEVIDPVWAYFVCANYFHESYDGLTDILNFQNLKALTPEAAAELFVTKDPKGKNRIRGWQLIDFPALKKIDEKTARALADNPRLPEIELFTKTRFASRKVADILLSVPQIKTWFWHHGRSHPHKRPGNGTAELTIPGLDADYPIWLMQYHLQKCPGITALNLQGSGPLKPSQVKAVSQCACHVTFRCEKFESVKTAEAIAKMIAPSITISELTDMTDEMADALIEFPGKINFNAYSNNILFEMLLNQARSRKAEASSN